MRYQIVPAEAWHVGILARDLRDMDRVECTCMGFVEARIGIWRDWRRSFYRRTALIDGVPAAMWGATGDLIGEANPWLMTTPAVEDVPVSFVRVGRREIQNLAARHRVLSGYVLARYTRAVRFLEVLGFSIGDPEPIGRDGELFRPYLMEA